jgi:predicted site-specific integrase-resolvase
MKGFSTFHSTVARHALRPSKIEDMLSLLSSLSSKIYGKRSAENRRKKKEAEQK